VDQYHWLLVFHLLGAFAFVSGAVAAGIAQLLSLRLERPSEAAAVLRLAQPAAAVAGVGSLVALGLGIALAETVEGYSTGDGWIVASFVLWIVAAALGGIGGRRSRGARELAERLAAERDEPTPELRRAILDPTATFANYASFGILVAILVLMIWKPGAV
jgi:uncharacterized membrane protein